MHVQNNNMTENDSISVDECLLRCGHIVERLSNCTFDMDDLNDFAESIQEELLNGNINDSEPPSPDDWESCHRLHAEDSQNFYLSAGYTDCMNEAIRFLVEEENMDIDHPVVRNLKNHLDHAKDRVLGNAVSTIDSENNNLIFPPGQTDFSYDYIKALNLFESSTICK